MEHVNTFKSFQNYERVFTLFISVIYFIYLFKI